MATENNPKANKKNKQRYLPHNKAVKKGSYPLRPGVQGFFITCDGGRERQTSHEAVNVIDSFYEELLHGTQSMMEDTDSSKQLLNKKIVFKYSDSSSSGDEDEGNEDDENGEDPKDECYTQGSEEKKEKNNGSEKKEQTECLENERGEIEGPPAKKQCVESAKTESLTTATSNKPKEQSIDRLIEAELAQLGDKSKRRFIYLDSGCNGVIFIQMRFGDGDPTPKDIVYHMVSSLAATKKHVSRFMLRLLPIEATCYTSDEELKRAIKPLIEKYFPSETQNPLKFAVLYDARANSGISRSKIIDTVAKSVPLPHKVDLNNPDLHIVVQIVKTVCLLGVVEKYKELAKYNVRQLTSSK